MADKEKTKKRLSVRKILLITLACVIAAILIVFLILALVPYKSFSDDTFTDYKYVNISNQDNISLGAVYKDGADTEADKKLSSLLSDGLKSTKYSALKAAIEFNYKNKPRFKTKEVTKSELRFGDDGPYYEDVTETERATVRGNYEEIKTYVQSTTGEFSLEFVYDETKSITVEDETVSFDRMCVVIRDTDGKLGAFELYLFEYAAVTKSSTETTPAGITPVIIQADSSELYKSLEDINDILK